jgi:hypothetical protein
LAVGFRIASDAADATPEYRTRLLGAALVIEEDLRKAEIVSNPMVDRGAARVVTMATVQALEVDWLWPGRLPAGMITVLDGPPDIGKSTVIVDIISRLTTGRPFPDESQGSRSAADVVLLGYEESPEHTVRPRLDAAGADPSRVHLLVDIGGRMPRLPDDGEAIERVVRDRGARLVVVDPVSAYIGQADFHRDNEVRAALAPLALIAERTGAAVLMVRHLRKAGGTDAIGRGLGSIATSALARTGLMLLAHPDDPKVRVLTWFKMNVARKPPSLRWRWAGSDGPPRVVWEGTCDLTADEILARQDRAHRLGGATGEAPTAVDTAEQWLMDQLRDHGEAPVTEIDERARREGISDKTLQRARRRLGVRARRENVTGGAPGKGRWLLAAPSIGRKGNEGPVQAEKASDKFKGAENSTLATLNIERSEVAANPTQVEALGGAFKTAKVKKANATVAALNRGSEGCQQALATFADGEALPLEDTGTDEVDGWT